MKLFTLLILFSLMACDTADTGAPQVRELSGPYAAETPAGIDEITTWADCDSIYAEWTVWFSTIDTWFCNHWYGLRKNPSEGYEYGWLNPPVYIGTDPIVPSYHGWRFSFAIARDDTDLHGGDYFVLWFYSSFSHSGPCYNTNFFRQIYSTPELIPICGSDGGKQPKPEN